jgi:hypothetical protein
MSLFLLWTFYAAMISAALAVEFLFAALGLVPEERTAKVVEASVTWNYTTVLNILFLLLAFALVWRSFTKGGFRMVREMNRPATEHA